MIADGENDGDRGPVIQAPTVREQRVASILSGCARMPDNDLAILAWIVARFPVSSLRARCLEITETGRCAALAPNTYEVTPREHTALAELLGAVKAIGLLVTQREGK